MKLSLRTTFAGVAATLLLPLSACGGFTEGEAYYLPEEEMFLGISNDEVIFGEVDFTEQPDCVDLYKQMSKDLRSGKVYDLASEGEIEGMLSDGGGTPQEGQATVYTQLDWLIGTMSEDGDMIYLTQSKDGSSDQLIMNARKEEGGIYLSVSDGYENIELFLLKADENVEQAMCADD